MKTYLKVFAEAYWYMELMYIAMAILHFTVGAEGFVLSWLMVFYPIPLAIMVTYFYFKFGMFTDVFGKGYLESVDKRQK